jgi:hypothetical protein
MTHAVTSVTTDKGTESGMVLAPGVLFDDYFPYFAQSDFLPDGEDMSRPQSQGRDGGSTAGGNASRPRSEGRTAECDAAVMASDDKLGMKQALPIHGLSHFINNVTKGIVLKCIH